MVQLETITGTKSVKLVINGDIDASSSINLDEALQHLCGEGKPPVLVDCNNLRYISSAGLGVFMSYIEELKNNKQTMVLFGLSDKVKNVFDMLGLDQLMNFTITEQEAEALLDEA